MVVHTRTSNFFSQKSTMICSRRDSVICPWATAIRASGTSSASSLACASIVETRLWMKNTWPSRMSSRRMAAETCLFVYGPTYVSTGWRSSGGVASVEVSRMPVMDISRVRGMGVADMASTSTSVRMALSFSLCSTPKRCSSSMITRPRFLNCISLLSSRWVPITTSTAPLRSPSMVALDSLAVWNRESVARRTGKPENRSANVSECCCASSVVGTSTATCLPSCTALNAARTATSVLP